MTLEYLGHTPVDLGAARHVMVSAVRNEILRLPFLLDYYRSIGVERFLFVDNDSDDGTRELLAGEKDCALFATTEGYRQAGMGISWINGLLHRFCEGRWILAIDADEMLVWPGSEGESLGQLTAALDAREADALAAPLLDMYSDKPFGAIGYRPGMNFLAACPYFDRGPYQTLKSREFPYHQVLGGVRARAMREVGATFHPPLLTKVPLVKWRAGQWFTASTHRLVPELPLAPMRGALLHFKMLDDLPEKCRVELARGEQFAGGREWRVLADAIAKRGGRSFFDEKISAHYEDTEQLVTLGIMSREKAFEAE